VIQKVKTQNKTFLLLSITFYQNQFFYTQSIDFNVCCYAIAT